MKIDDHIKNLEEYCQDDIEFRSQTAEERYLCEQVTARSRVII